MISNTLESDTGGVEHSRLSGIKSDGFEHTS